MNIGNEIQRIRKEKCLTQEEFGSIFHVTRQAVSNWENDNVLPSIDMLTKIADVFKVRTDYLLGREERAYLDVSGLTEEQKGHISLIIKDFERLNEK